MKPDFDPAFFMVPRQGRDLQALRAGLEMIHKESTTVNQEHGAYLSSTDGYYPICVQTK
jgi:hypothetical protein